MMCRQFMALLLAPGLLIGSLAQTGRAADQGARVDTETRQEMRSPSQLHQQENRQTERLRLRHELRQQRHQQHRLQHNGPDTLASPVGPTHGRR